MPSHECSGCIVRDTKIKNLNENLRVSLAARCKIEDECAAQTSQLTADLETARQATARLHAELAAARETALQQEKRKEFLTQRSVSESAEIQSMIEQLEVARREAFRQRQTIASLNVALDRTKREPLKVSSAHTDARRSDHSQASGDTRHFDIGDDERRWR